MFSKAIWHSWLTNCICNLTPDCLDLPRFNSSPVLHVESVILLYTRAKASASLKSGTKPIISEGGDGFRRCYSHRGTCTLALTVNSHPIDLAENSAECLLQRRITTRLPLHVYPTMEFEKNEAEIVWASRRILLLQEEPFPRSEIASALGPKLTNPTRTSPISFEKSYHGNSTCAGTELWWRIISRFG